MAVADMRGAANIVAEVETAMEDHMHKLAQVDMYLYSFDEKMNAALGPENVLSKSATELMHESQISLGLMQVALVQIKRMSTIIESAL
jgi:hypothetical protein